MLVYTQFLIKTFNNDLFKFWIFTINEKFCLCEEVIQIYLNHCSVLEIKLHYSSCCVNYKVFCLYLKSLYSDDILWLGFSGGSVVKNLPAMQEMQVWSLGREDLLEKEMATHSSVLAWEIP